MHPEVLGFRRVCGFLCGLLHVYFFFGGGVQACPDVGAEGLAGFALKG